MYLLPTRFGLIVVYVRKYVCTQPKRWCVRFKKKSVGALRADILVTEQTNTYTSYLHARARKLSCQKLPRNWRAAPALQHWTHYGLISQRDTKFSQETHGR